MLNSCPSLVDAKALKQSCDHDHLAIQVRHPDHCGTAYRQATLSKTTDARVSESVASRGKASTHLLKRPVITRTNLHELHLLVDEGRGLIMSQLTTSKGHAGADPGFFFGGGGGGGGQITLFTSGGGYGRGRGPSREERC